MIAWPVQFDRAQVRYSFSAAVFAVLMAAGGLAAESVPVGPAFEQTVLRVGIPRLAFVNLNENDAMAACRAFVASLGRKRGYDIQPDVLVFDTLSKMETAVRDGTVNVAILGTWQLLDSNLADLLDLEFVPVTGNSAAHRMLLLTRRGSAIRAASDLRRRSVLVLMNTRTTLGRPWLDTLCLAAGIGPAESELRSFDLVGRPNAAILPVFFGRADACVVDEETFANACELNPQLGRELVPIARSEPMINSIVAINPVGWKSARNREDLRQGLTELHREPYGRQILTLFRFDRLVPLEAGMLDSVAALHRQHLQLHRKWTAASPPSGAPLPPTLP